MATVNLLFLIRLPCTKTQHTLNPSSVLQQPKLHKFAFMGTVAIRRGWRRTSHSNKLNWSEKHSSGKRGGRPDGKSANQLLLNLNLGTKTRLDKRRWRHWVKWTPAPVVARSTSIPPFPINEHCTPQWQNSYIYLVTISAITIYSIKFLRNGKQKKTHQSLV